MNDPSNRDIFKQLIVFQSDVSLHEKVFKNPSKSLQFTLHYLADQEGLIYQYIHKTKTATIIKQDLPTPSASENDFFETYVNPNSVEKVPAGFSGSSGKQNLEGGPKESAIFIPHQPDSPNDLQDPDFDSSSQLYSYQDQTFHSYVKSRRMDHVTLTEV
jgi:hypothetical protein